MATIYDLVVVAHDETTGNAQADLIADTGYIEQAGLKLKDYVKRIVNGSRPAVVQTKVNAVKASGTITLSAHVATDTVTISGVVFTCMASGATGPQYNVGGTDSITADNLVAAILANATVDGMITASNASGVVTVTALLPGEAANGITLAISAHGSVSAARMAGGTNGDAERTHYYGSVVGG